jgi:hypothetical protein
MWGTSGDGLPGNLDERFRRLIPSGGWDPGERGIVPFSPGFMMGDGMTLEWQKAKKMGENE